MWFFEYVTHNFVMIFELIGLLLILFISVHASKKTKLFTRLTVFALVVTEVISALEAWTQTFETLSPWRYILTAVKYTLYPLVIIVLIQLIGYMSKPLSRKWSLLLLIPEVVSLPFFFTSQWTHLIFYFSESNGYHGGVLAYWPYVVFGLYFAVFVVQNSIFLKRFSLRSRLIAAFITVGALLYVCLSAWLGASDDFVPIFTSALVFYFLFLYILMASTDTLTGLFNRQAYYQDLRVRKDHITHIVSVDMNDLKLLNDTFGHAEGDKALKVIATAMRENVGDHGTIYRVGGDEFIILFVRASEGDVSDRIHDIKDAISKTIYSCAFGCAAREGRTVDETLKAADRLMYEEKVRLKASGKIKW